jgi:biopolymer transport protein ExbD
MITTPLMYQANIEVKLPEAKAGKPAEGTGQKEAYITVDKQGLVYLSGKVITRKELKEKIKELHKDNPGLNVILRSDKATKFQDIVYLLDMLTELGVAKLNIAVAEEG